MDTPQTAATAAAGATAAPAPKWVKLLNDVDGVGLSGRVVQGSASRVQPWIDAGDAALATDAEVSMAAPFHIILED